MTPQRRYQSYWQHMICGPGPGGAEGQRLRLERADLTGCDSFAGTNLSGIVLQGCLLRDAGIADARLLMPEILACDLRGVNLAFSDLSCSLMSSNLEGAIISDAKTTPFDLTGDSSKPWPTNMEGCRLRQADLRNTSLKHVRVKHAHLKGARFSAASTAGMTKDQIDRLRSTSQ